MISYFQRQVVFYVFLIIVVALAAIEFYAIVSVINGLTLTNGIIAATCGVLLVPLGKLFVTLVSSTVDIRKNESLERLQDFVVRRANESVRGSYPNYEPFEARKILVEQTLGELERQLRGRIPGDHFELSVFVDPEQPLMFAYYETTGRTLARSMPERAANPFLYVQRGYEVVGLLANPTSHPRIIKRTVEEGAGYVFISDEQRMQIKSTLLMCIDLEVPCVLVVCSNKQDAFVPSDRELLTVVRIACDTIRSDLFEARLITNVRQIRPQLFY